MGADASWVTELPYTVCQTYDGAQNLKKMHHATLTSSISRWFVIARLILAMSPPTYVCTKFEDSFILAKGTKHKTKNLK